jgi:hypothetical protein
MPVLAQVESRNWGMPYAVLVGFCAFGFHPLSASQSWSRQPNWVLLPTWPEA